MGRRVVFLAALGLAACMADTPTEPTITAEGEGLAFLAAPPPPPAPPTVLSGDLDGANGFPGLVSLGVYESPVYSKVTVSGLLDYHGQGGYLAGDGQIDAAGFFIPNQCSLIVRVRAGTGVIGGPVSCPNQPRQIGNYTNYAVVNGPVDFYRTAGPPGSCWKYAPPCITITGSQTVTIEPVEGQLVLTPNKTLVAPGGGITVLAKGVWADSNAVLVPMSVREWRWEGKGAEVGGGHTKVCAVYNPNQCVVQVYQSGNVVLEALVNGKVKTGKVWVAVIGGG